MLTGFLEIAVYLERFRNIDLFQQGLYYIRISVAKGATFAQPYDVVKPAKADPLSCLIPANYDPLEPWVNSSTFLIRYSEEEAHLRELWTLRFEGTAEDMDALVLTAELCYSEFDRDFKDLPSLAGRMDTTDSIKFKPVSSVKIALKNPRGCILEPLVIEFEELQKSLVLGSIYCVLFDYRFRSSEKRSNGLVSSNVAEALFTDSQGQPKLLAGVDETERLYAQYVHPQALSHELLRSYLADVITRYLPADQKQRYSDLPPPLSLPLYCSANTPKAASFSAAVNSHEVNAICEALLSDISQIAMEIYHLMERLRQLIVAFPLHCMSPLFEKRQERLRNWSGCSVRKTQHQVAAIPLVQPSDLESQRKRTALEMRKLNRVLPSLYESSITEPLGSTTTGPVLFLDAYFRTGQTSAVRQQPEKRWGHRRKHLFVLVHGLHGRAIDMRLVKHAVTCYSTVATVMCSTANEEDTERDLFDMGERLAREVKTYIGEWLPGKALARLSFIGYSLGGLIIRAAFPHLAEYAPLMHAYVTFSTPHIGHMSEVSLVGAGLWMLERFNRTQLLQQLLLGDNADPRRTALYRLSQSPGLEWFNYVVLCSSYQDRYVPHQSARMEVAEGLRTNRAELFSEMAGHLLQSLDPDSFMRVDVDFHQSGLSLDKMTGRSAHLQFISSDHFLRLLIYQFPEVFS